MQREKLRIDGASVSGAKMQGGTRSARWGSNAHNFGEKLRQGVILLRAHNFGEKLVEGVCRRAMTRSVDGVDRRNHFLYGVSGDGGGGESKKPRAAIMNTATNT